LDKGIGSYLTLFSHICSLIHVSSCIFPSLPAQLADQQQFPDSVQRDLTRTFTLINSMGMIGSFIVGSLLDRVGLEWCTVLTLMWGQLHVVFAYTSATTGISDTRFMLTNFGMYMLFRNFLYPVYIASITERLGFKYFGVLLGIGFAISGVTQLSMTALDEWVQGDCHLQQEAAEAAAVGDDTAAVADTDGNDGDATTFCNAGWWNPLHVIQFIQLGGLMLCPILDRWEIRNRTAKVKSILGTPPPPCSSLYGSL
jgi:hypothetical protein